jgi:hypothetical protein
MPSDAEVCSTHVRAFFGTEKRKCNAAEVSGSHGREYAGRKQLWLGKSEVYDRQAIMDNG